MNCDVWTSSGSLRQQDSELPASLAEAETLRLVAYLREHGHRVRSGRDVYEAIRSLPDEEELGAEQRSDGVVVTHASDGWEMLIPLGELMPLSLDVATDTVEEVLDGLDQVSVQQMVRAGKLTELAGMAALAGSKVRTILENAIERIILEAGVLTEGATQEVAEVTLEIARSIVTTIERRLDSIGELE